jgi:hypothetical protein
MASGQTELRANGDLICHIHTLSGSPTSPAARVMEVIQGHLRVHHTCPGKIAGHRLTSTSDQPHIHNQPLEQTFWVTRLFPGLCQRNPRWDCRVSRHQAGYKGVGRCAAPCALAIRGIARAGTHKQMDVAASRLNYLVTNKQANCLPDLRSFPTCQPEIPPLCLARAQVFASPKYISQYKTLRECPTTSKVILTSVR